MNLDGRRALVTGATGGIGKAIARALAGEGASLVLTGRQADVLEALAQETGGRAVVSDLSQPDAAERLAADAGDVDVLVGNAAVPGSWPFQDYTVEEIDRALTVNLRAPILLAHALLPAMIARGAGHVVFVSSLSGKAASPGSSIYSATKFGLRGFTLGLREDLADTGVGASLVFPGFISGEGMFAKSGAKLPPFVGMRPPEAVARAVVAAIKRDRAEISVAPVSLRAGTALAGLFPGPVNALQRRLGARKIAEEMARGQRGSD
jgi:short-subunit dehydrogenase